jgi:hypothetical protein
VGNIADPLWSPLADAQSPAAAEYLGNGVLSAAGVNAASVESAEKMNFVNSSNPELIATIRRHAPAGVLCGSTVGGVSFSMRIVVQFAAITLAKATFQGSRTFQPFRRAGKL